MRRGSLILQWTKAYLIWASVLVVVLIALSSTVWNGNDPETYSRRFEAFSLFMLLGTGGVAWLFWWPISRRLARMRETVEEYGEGRYERRMAADGASELDELASHLNWMAQQLRCREQAESARWHQQQTVLASMLEGMLAVDEDGCVISMNRAAREMLRIERSDMEGRLLSELVREQSFLHYMRRALARTAENGQVLVLNGRTARTIELSYTPLTVTDGVSAGVLIMMNDITRMRQLEGVRRDFVANVSHELKTPITSIKGFMETLLDGALNDPEDARRFLKIIAKQADRLDAIIEDLLALSRIEQEAGRGELQLETVGLRDAIHNAAQAVELRAKKTNSRVDWQCSEDLQARANLPLLEHALINLIDNAIKYGGSGSHVTVRAAREGGRTLVSVTDNGPGIAEEHQQRIFERFYRVDKSRSRKMGGTGLGLAIVKHIVHAHHGTIQVQSTPGKGSTFTIALPGASASSCKG